MSNLQVLNRELEQAGLPIIDNCIERSKYLGFLTAMDLDDPKDIKKLTSLKTGYLLQFHVYIAGVYPHLLFEQGEDKIYWNYNNETGVYDEINFSTVRGLILKLMIDDELTDKATEANVKTILAKYRSIYSNRANTYDDFDTNNGWFHCNNGWVNVATLMFESHTPARLSRRKSAVKYDAVAMCPIYDDFLDKKIEVPKDQVRVIDQFSGLLLTPDINKQKMLVLIGKPGCGKSTLLDAWADVLGDLATEKKLSEISSDSMIRFSGADLVDKRLCWFDEVDVKRSEMGNQLTTLVTGQTIRVERKGINGILKPQNTLKCVLTANSLPKSAEIGIYRRMLLIYFNYSFTENLTENHNIRHILQLEASGILNRMLRGLKDLTTQKVFTVMTGHDDLIEDYKTESSTIAEFLDTHFDFDYDAPKLTSKTLLDAYKDFSNDRYSSSLTPVRFGVMLSNHGLRKFKSIISLRGTGGVRMWGGLKLKENYELNQAGFIREKVDF